LNRVIAATWNNSTTRRRRSIGGSPPLKAYQPVAIIGKTFLS
jgi:hypothetical protein